MRHQCGLSQQHRRPCQTRGTRGTVSRVSHTVQDVTASGKLLLALRQPLFCRLTPQTPHSNGVQPHTELIRHLNLIPSGDPLGLVSFSPRPSYQSIEFVQGQEPGFALLCGQAVWTD